MARGVKRQPTRPELEPFKEPYPQHAKMYPHSSENWAIREFVAFLATEKKISVGSHDQLEAWLCEFRGVDQLEYEAEAAKLKSEYRWLWNKLHPTVARLTDAIKEIPVPVAEIPVPKPVAKTQSGEDGLAFLLAKIRGGKDA